jgi:fatty acid desaturase
MDNAVRDLDRREMFAEIKKLCLPNNYTNWWVLLRQWCIFAVVVATCCAWHRLVTDRGWPIALIVPVYVLSAFIIGAWVQNRLSCLVHEASHYVLFKNRVLNDLVANLFVAFPFFGTISNYRIGHWAHHRHVNDPQHDPDLQRLSKHHPRNFPISRSRFLWEYVILQLSPHKAYTYLKGRALYVAFAAKQDRLRDHDALGGPLTRTLRVAFYLALAAVLTFFGWWMQYLLFWLVPLVTFYPAMLFLRETAHHGNYPDDGDFTNSRVYEGYALERELFFPFGERNHVLHHMFPTVPWHQMNAAHQVMLRYPPYREQVVICDGFFVKRHRHGNQPDVLEILSSPAEAQIAQFPGEHATIRAETAVAVDSLKDVSADELQLTKSSSSTS